METKSWNPVLSCASSAPGCCARPAPSALVKPLHWRGHTRVHVGTVADIFNPDVEDDYVKAVIHTMALANWHNFLVLTKFPTRLRDILSGPCGDISWMPHIWWGVRIESMAAADAAIGHLRETPAKVRFLSFDPLVEEPKNLDLRGLDWVTTGGQNRADAAPLDPDWVRSLRDQCAAFCVPFHFRQWPRVGNRNSGRTLDDHVHDARPQTLCAPLPSEPQRQALITEVSGMAWEYDLSTQFYM